MWLGPRPDPGNVPSVDAQPAPFTRRQTLTALGALALPWDRLAAAESARPAGTDGLGPDLANLHDLLAATARDHAPKLSFLEERFRDLAGWKAIARPALLDHLAYRPEAKPVGAELLGRESREGFTLERLRLDATSSYPIPARLLLPDRPGRRPAIVALHCHSARYTWGHEKLISHPDDPAFLQDFRAGTYGRPWAEALARRGYVVLVADAFYFGERRLRVEDLEPSRVFSEVREPFAVLRSARPGTEAWTAAANRIAGFYEHLTAKGISAAGTTWPAWIAWDDRRTIDYLETRPEVDPTRMGCAGLSLGGIRGAHLIGTDPRLKAACLTGWMTSFPHQLRHHLRHTWMAFTPGLLPALDLPDVAGLHAPGALLVQQCARDTLFPRSGMEAAVDKLGRLYAKAGCPERFRGVFHDVPHSFPPSLQEEAFDWFDRWL